MLLKIHYSFPMKFWLLLCLFLPPFHFSFMISAIIMSVPLMFPVLMPLPNYYKRFSIEGKTDLSEGRVPPQKLIEIMQVSNSIWTGTRRYSDRRKFDKFLVWQGVSPITQISYTYEYRMCQSKTEFTCASPKKEMLQSETGNSHCWTRVMSYYKRVGLAGDSQLHTLVRTLTFFFLLPTFSWNPFFFFYNKNWLLSYLFLLSFLLWCLCHNYYEYMAIEEKKGVSEG